MAQKASKEGLIEPDSIFPTYEGERPAKILRFLALIRTRTLRNLMAFPRSS